MYSAANTRLLPSRSTCCCLPQTPPSCCTVRVSAANHCGSLSTSSPSMSNSTAASPSDAAVDGLHERRTYRASRPCSGAGAAAGMSRVGRTLRLHKEGSMIEFEGLPSDDPAGSAGRLRGLERRGRGGYWSHRPRAGAVPWRAVRRGRPRGLLRLSGQPAHHLRRGTRRTRDHLARYCGVRVIDSRWT